MSFILQLILRMFKYLVSSFSALSWAQVFFILVIVVLLVLFLIVAFKFWVFFDLPAPELPELSEVEETPSTAPAPGDSPSGTGGSTGGWPTWLWVAAGVGGIMLILVSSDLIIFGDQGYVMSGLRDLAGLFGGGPNGGQPGDLPAVPAVAQDAVLVNPQVVFEVPPVPQFANVNPSTYFKDLYMQYANDVLPVFDTPVLTQEAVQLAMQAVERLNDPEISFVNDFLKDNPALVFNTMRDIGAKVVYENVVFDMAKEFFKHKVSSGDISNWVSSVRGSLSEEESRIVDFFIELVSRK